MNNYNALDKNQLNPKRRSKFRLKLGKVYYAGKRYFLWNCCKYKFAKKMSNKKLKFSIYQHQSILLRNLKDVEMQYQYNKIVNLKLASKRLDGLVLYPGETFSYWKLIGNPTERKGYLQGMVLESGNFKYGIGGGLCQLSNLIYWMTLHTPLEVVERYRHSYDVFPDSNRTIPFGSGATCVYPYRDLMIKNNTPMTYQLCISVGEKYLKGEWRSLQQLDFSYKVVEKGHRMQAEFWGGYSRHNKLYRQKYAVDGTMIEEEYITENHALMMYSPFLEEREE